MRERKIPFKEGRSCRSQSISNPLVGFRITKALKLINRWFKPCIYSTPCRGYWERNPDCPCKHSLHISPCSAATVVGLMLLWAELFSVCLRQVFLSWAERRWEEAGETERKGSLTPEAVQVDTLSVTHSQGFPLLLKDAAYCDWLDLENEQCTAGWSTSGVFYYCRAKRCLLFSCFSLQLGFMVLFRACRRQRILLQSIRVRVRLRILL